MVPHLQVEAMGSGASAGDGREWQVQNPEGFVVHTALYLILEKIT